MAAGLCCLLLVACAGGQSSPATAGRVAASPSQVEAPDASPSSGAGSTATASPGCEDPSGDSTGALDLTSVAVDASDSEVFFVYTYGGTLPATGSVLFSTQSGSKQYGYKVVDGEKSSNFIFDSVTSKQKSVETEAQVTPTEATVTFARNDVDIDDLAGGTATTSVDGQDNDECQLR